MARTQATYINRVTVEADDTDAQVANLATIQQRAHTALDNNRTWLGHAAYPASPTNTQRDTAIRSLLDQVDALTRQNSALIRLVLNLLDDASDV